MISYSDAKQNQKIRQNILQEKKTELKGITHNANKNSFKDLKDTFHAARANHIVSRLAVRRENGAYYDVIQKKEGIVQLQQTNIYFKGSVSYKERGAAPGTAPTVVVTEGDGVYLTTTGSHPAGHVDYIEQFQNKIRKDLGVPRDAEDVVITGNTYGRRP